MNSSVRILLISFASILFLLIAALGLGIYKFNTYERVFNWALYKNTGYRFTAEDVSFQFSPTKVLVTDLALHNPEFTSDPRLIRVGNAEFSIEVSNFLKNKFPFWNASLNNVEVVVKENKYGNINWYTSTLAEKKSDTKEGLDLTGLLSFSEITIENSKVTHAKGGSVEELNIPSLTMLRLDKSTVKIGGVGIYEDEQLKIDGEISVNDSDSNGQELQFALQASGLDVNINANGKFNPQNPDGASAYLNAKSENLDAIENLLQENLPDIEPIDISVELTSSKGIYEASKMHIQLGKNVISGDILFNTQDQSVRADLSADIIDFTPYLQNETKVEIASSKKEAEQRLDGIAAEEPEINWTWIKSFAPNVNINIGQIIAGQKSIKDFGLSVNFENSLINIDSLQGRYLEFNKDNPEKYISSELINISGTLQPLDEKTIGKDIIVSLSIAEADTKIIIDGNINLNGAEGTTLKIDAKSSSLDFFANYLQKDLSPYLPASLTADLETIDNGLTLVNLSAKSKESDLSGDIKFDWSSEKVNISGTLSSQLIDVSPLQYSGRKGDDVYSQKEIDTFEERVFSDEDINWNWLSSYNVALALEIKKFIASTILTGLFGEQAPDNIFHDVSTKVELNNGNLIVDPLTASSAGGNIQANFLLTKIENGAKFEIDFKALNMSLEKLGASGESVISGGVSDIVFVLSGKGSTSHQLASSLNGEFILEIQEATIDNNVFELVGGDIFLKMINTISPFVKEEKTTELECAAIKFVAKDGVLKSKKQMAIESTRMKIVGSGKIDMHSEDIAIGFTPIAKSGIGVNVGNIVKFVYLGGTLSNPKMENDPLGIAESGVAVTAAVATGGLSLIAEGLFKRVTNAGDICARALEDAESDQEENQSD